jgi:hypothetical protein
MSVFKQLGVDQFTVAESSAHGLHSAFDNFGLYSLEQNHNVDFAV